MVKDLLGVDNLLIVSIFHVKARVRSLALSYAKARDFLESFNKLVEQREALKV